MSSGHFDHVARLLVELRNLDGEEREARLAALQAEHPAVCAEVRSLLARGDGVGGFLEQPLVPVESMLREADAEGSVPLPKSIGPYHVLECIGVGGMGVVYRARQESPGREVAIKLLRSHMMTQGLRRRFRSEAEILGQLHHPGIAQVYDAGTLAGEGGARPYFVMELIRGRQLLRFADERGLDTPARLRLFTLVCHALEHAHRLGIVHRDLKPDNILVTDQGQPKILDFGIARVTNTDIQITTMQTSAGQVIGTLAYMSPEQVVGRVSEVDARSDVYALGVVLFELLSGRLPHELRDRSVPEAARIVQEQDPTRLDSINTTYRGDIDTIVSKAIEREPVRRYGSAAALAEDIRRHLENIPITARPVSRRYRLAKFARRNRGLVIGLVLTMAAITLGGLASLVFAVYGITQQGLAERQAEHSERVSYRLSIGAAATELASGDELRARQSLLLAPEALRRWEWFYLWNRLDAFVPEPSEIRGKTTPEVALLADGQVLVAISDGAGVRVVDADDGSLICELDQADGIDALRFDQTGERLVGHLPLGITIWDARTGAVLRVFDCGWVPDIVGDGFMVAWSGAFVALVDLDTGMARDMLVEGDFVSRTRFSHGGDRIAIHVDSTPEQRLLVVDAESGEILAGQRLHEQQFPDQWPAWSPSDTLLADRFLQPDIFVRDAETLKILHTIRMSEAPNYKISSGAHAFVDDSHIAYTELDGEVMLLELTTGALRTLTPALPGKPVNRMSMIGGRLAIAGEGWVRLHDAREERQIVLRHESYVYLAAWNPDGSLLATAGWDKAVRLWNGHTGEALGVLKIETDADTPAIPTGMTFVDAGRRLEVVTTQGTGRGDPVRVISWDLATGTRSEAAFADRDAYLLEAPPGIRLDGRPPQDLQVAAGDYRAVSPDGRKMVFPGPSGPNVATRTEPGTAVPLNTMGDQVACFGPKSRVLATGDANGVVRLWDAQSCELLTSCGVLASPILSIAFSVDGQRLVATGLGGVILCDAQTLEVLLQLHGHTDYVRSAAFSPDGSRLVTLSGDTTARIWDASSMIARRAWHDESAEAERTVRPLVDSWFAETGDAGAVWDRVASEPGLSPAQRTMGRLMLVRQSP